METTIEGSGGGGVGAREKDEVRDTGGGWVGGTERQTEIMRDTLGDNDRAKWWRGGREKYEVRDTGWRVGWGGGR